MVLDLVDQGAEVGILLGSQFVVLIDDLIENLNGDPK